MIDEPHEMDDNASRGWKLGVILLSGDSSKRLTFVPGIYHYYFQAKRAKKFFPDNYVSIFIYPAGDNAS